MIELKYFKISNKKMNSFKFYVASAKAKPL